MYRVIVPFIDLQDGERPYNVGDVYPCDGKKVSEARIEQLASQKNRRKTALIEYVEEKPQEVVEPVKRTRKKKG